MPRFAPPDPLELLIVHRDERVSRCFAAAARQTGWFAPVCCLSDGRFALEHIVTRVAENGAPPDVIITDLALPGLNGFQLTRELRRLEATRAIFIAVVTARGSALEQDAAENAGCDFFLRTPEKPHRHAALLCALAQRCQTRLSPPQGMLC